MQSRNLYHDFAGRLKALVQPEVAATLAATDVDGAAITASATYSYDDADNLTSKTDARGTTTYTYDLADRRATASGADVAAVYCYDGKTVKADGTGCEGSAVALSQGKPSEVGMRYDNIRAYVVKYSYDWLGRYSSSVQLQRPTGESSDLSLSFTCTYYRDGSLETMRYPSDRVVTYAYDTGARLSSILGAKVGQTGRNYASSMSVDHAGRITRMSYRGQSVRRHRSWLPCCGRSVECTWRYSRAGGRGRRDICWRGSRDRPLHGRGLRMGGQCYRIYVAYD